jgi:hypothetical protein
MTRLPPQRIPQAGLASPSPHTSCWRAPVTSLLGNPERRERQLRAVARRGTAQAPDTPWPGLSKLPGTVRRALNGTVGHGHFSAHRARPLLAVRSTGLEPTWLVPVARGDPEACPRAGASRSPSRRVLRFAGTASLASSCLTPTIWRGEPVARSGLGRAICVASAFGPITIQRGMSDGVVGMSRAAGLPRLSEES